MGRILKMIAGSLPIIFAFVFLAPVVDTALIEAGLSTHWGLSSTSLALMIGGAWGLIATAKGRWV